MNFLGRKVQTQETEKIDGRVIHREIEITVEREWLSIAAGGRAGESTQAAAGDPAGTGQGPPVSPTVCGPLERLQDIAMPEKKELP